MMNPESGIRELFSEISESLDMNDRKFIAEELDAREWAVALDLILYLAERRARPLSEKTRSKMYALATTLKIKLEDRRRGWPK